MKNRSICLAAGICYLFLTFLPLESRLNELNVILEQSLSKACVIKSKQIKIPGYPNAYNPSLISYKDGYLLSFRFISRCPKAIKNNLRRDFSFVGLVKLNKKFKISEKTVQTLNIVSYSPKFSLTAEDARLLSVGNRIFIFFNDLPLLHNPGKNAMYFAELIEEEGGFVLNEPAKPLNYPYANEVEKNWSPFSSGDSLYVIYSDQPRIILEVDLNTGYCQEVMRTLLNWNWNFGEIRGGTPAYLVNNTFLTFFHSSFLINKTSKRRAYVMGAYTFEKDPPFSICKMTIQPLGDLTDYTQNNSSKVVFPAGLVVEDNFVHVAWGKADRQIFITTFDKEKLLTSMMPPSE